MSVKSVASCTVSAALLLAGLSASSAYAQGDTVALQLFGQRHWVVMCTLTLSDGDTIAASDRGRGDESTGRLVALDVVSGECDYTVSENGMLRITLPLESTSLDCPFEVTEDGLCRAYFSGGAAGGFTLRSLAVSDTDTGS